MNRFDYVYMDDSRFISRYQLYLQKVVTVLDKKGSLILHNSI